MLLEPLVLDSDSNIILSTVTLYQMLILDVIVGQMRSTQDAWCTEMMHWVFVLCAADIPEEEARYWAKKLEQLNAMRDQDVRLLSLHHIISVSSHLYLLPAHLFLYLP